MAHVQYRLMSRRSDKAEWGCRNDGFHRSHERPELALKEAYNQLNGWLAVEANTQFKIQFSEDGGHSWRDILGGR